jgi:hypothetical protein
MKTPTLAGMLIALLFASCNKNTDKSTCNAGFVITKTSTASPVLAADGINTDITSYGANSCYTFTQTEVKQITGNTFEIRSIGKVTCGANVCADVLVGAQETVHISTPLTGTYILRFYNGASLFRSDTVQVN